MVSVIYGIGVQALGDSDCAGMEEKHRKPVLRASRAGARRTLVANISSPRQLMLRPSHDGRSASPWRSEDAIEEARTRLIFYPRRHALFL